MVEFREFKLFYFWVLLIWQPGLRRTTKTIVQERREREAERERYRGREGEREGESSRILTKTEQ